MSKATRWVLVLFSLTFALGWPPSDVQARSRRGKKTRAVSFDDDAVEATFLRPEGSVTNSLSKKRRSSLVRIRMHFFAELLRSARNL